jgi:aryl-alcohol dehydrogenase-like predicted oxidoreductase
MNYRSFGKRGWQVSEVGYGAWGIGGTQWLGGSDQESLAALRRALELGINFIDTALAYGDGHSEQLVGQVVRETGAEAIIATKIPPRNRLWPARPGIGIEEVFPYAYCMESTEQSLANLGVETIDLQQFHVWNPEWFECDEWRRVIEDLKSSGKVRRFGISINDHQPDTALAVCRSGLIDSVQVIFNVFDQSPAVRLLPLAAELGIGVLARCPFDEGALAGAIRADTAFDPNDFRAFYFRGERKGEVIAKVAALEADLGAYGHQEPLAATALRFCLSHPAVSSVIPGMRRAGNVLRNASAAALGPLPGGLLELVRRHAWNKNYYC